MTVFKSKYREMSFYVDGKLLSFNDSSFSTNDKKIIAELENMRGVVKISEEKPKAEEPKKKDAKKKPSAK